LNKNPSYRLSKSDILRFADPRLENKVRVNGINLTKGKQNLYYKKQCQIQIQVELDLVRVSEEFEFELSEFELAGFYCIIKDYFCLGKNPNGGSAPFTTPLERIGLIM
jgi:hypothetical protein